MSKAPRFSHGLVVSICSALLLLLPCAAGPQINNLTDDQSTPVPAAGQDYTGMANRSLNRANVPVSLRPGM